MEAACGQRPACVRRAGSGVGRNSTQVPNRPGAAPHPTPPLGEDQLWARKTAQEPSGPTHHTRLPCRRPVPRQRAAAAPSAGRAHLATRQRISMRSQLPLGITPCQHGGTFHTTQPGLGGRLGAAGARQGRGAHRPAAGASLALRASVQGRLTSLVAVLGPPFRGAGGAKTLPASAGGHSPEGSHHPNGVTCTLLFPPVQRRARRRAGRRAERRDCPPGGRTGPHFCSPVCKGPALPPRPQSSPL